jgi:hypothetical protein
MTRRDLIKRICGAMAVGPTLAHQAVPIKCDPKEWEVSYEFDAGPIALSSKGMWDGYGPGNLQLKSIKYRRLGETQWHEVTA